MDGAVNIEAYIRSLEKEYIPQARAAAGEALYRFASKIITDAKQLCPKKTGTLAASGVVLDPVIEGGGEQITVTLGFNTNYAAAVHEILTNHHPNGQAKYLETPLMAQAPNLGPYVLAAIQEAVR